MVTEQGAKSRGLRSRCAKEAHRLHVILVALNFLESRIAQCATAFDFLHYAYERRPVKLTLPKACDFIRELACAKREDFYKWRHGSKKRCCVTRQRYTSDAA